MENEFKDFEGPDKWEKFERLRKKMHEEAVKDYFAILSAEAETNGKTRAVVSYKHKLKDGSYLTKEDTEKDAKENGTEYYSVHETPTERRLRLMRKEIEAKKN